MDRLLFQYFASVPSARFASASAIGNEFAGVTLDVRDRKAMNETAADLIVTLYQTQFRVGDGLCFISPAKQLNRSLGVIVSIRLKKVAKHCLQG